MKIALITTYPNAPEVTRIKDEAALLGHELQVIDFESFGFSIIDNKLELTGLTDLSVDLVIIRGIFTAIRSLTPFIDYLNHRGILVFDNNLSVHKYAINKITDFMKLAIGKLPMPDTYYSRTPELYTEYAEKLGFPVVMKSVRMGKGASVVKLDTPLELQNYLAAHVEETGGVKDLVMQEFIDYRFDLRVFVVGAKMFSMRRIPSKSDFRANFSLGGAVEPYVLSEPLKILSQQAINAVELEVAGVDILLDEGGKPYILEVNHTPGMCGVEEATGENITREYLLYAIKNAK